ncbi:DEAD/DEAH box helicase [Pelagibacteraceae bacterium]|nr:DEAD/DEAH box helicase [Pelagibacteraceae bacterium]
MSYKLTEGQKKVINEIDLDLRSNLRMFRILQGDVGSGKTIVACVSAINSIESGYQCGLMAPTSILAEQHYKLLNNLINQSNLKINVELLTGKTEAKKRKKNIN